MKRYFVPKIWAKENFRPLKIGYIDQYGSQGIDVCYEWS